MAQHEPRLAGPWCRSRRCRLRSQRSTCRARAAASLVRVRCAGIEGDPEAKRYRAELLQPDAGIDAHRGRGRRTLLDAMEQAAGGRTNPIYQRAYRLLESEAVRNAMDVEREPPAVRDRYGFGDLPAKVGAGGGGGNGAEMGVARQLRGQNLLLARRLVEAGVRCHRLRFQTTGPNWDAHFQCADQHKRHLLPQADQGLSALIETCTRGLLDSTLVVAMGNWPHPLMNKEAGRDHWPDCYSMLFAGGGVRGGSVYGASDRIGAFPALDPVTPGDLAATIFWRFGLDPATEIHDQTGRPHRLASGEPLRRLFA